MSAQIYLIRHGETEWALSGRHTGRTEVPLTARGEEAARGLGERLHDVQFSKVFSSPRQRAQKTCALAGLDGAEVDQDLAEWDYGDYEGLKSSEVLPGRPGWNIFRDGCLGGESPAQIADRADRVIARLRMLEGNIAIFSHGHFGRVLGVRWIGLPVKEGQSFMLDTTAVSILSCDEKHGHIPVISSWNVI